MTTLTAGRRLSGTVCPVRVVVVEAPAEFIELTDTGHELRVEGVTPLPPSD